MAKGKKYTRADPAEITRRVDEVIRFRMDGMQLHDLIDHAAQQTPPWNVSERQLARYIEQADDLISKRVDKSRKRIIGLHLARRDALFARAVNAADLRTALAILDSKARLEGLLNDARDLKELLKIIAVQEQRLRDMEQRLTDAADGPNSATPPQ